MSASITSARSIADRLGALSGAAYVLLIVVGNQVASGGQQESHPSGTADLADFVSAVHPTTALVVGMTMETLGMLFLPFFLGWLAHRLAQRGAGWLGTVAAIGGGVTLSVKMASFMPMGAGVADSATLDARTAQVLADMNAAAFVATFLTFGVFLVAAGFGILSSGILGRLAGWSAVVLGVLGVVLTLLTHVDEANSNPMPFLAGLLWLLVTSLLLGTRGPRAARERMPALTPEHAA